MAAYSTTDIILAATLLDNGGRLYKINVIENQGEFTITDIDPEWVDQYEMDNITVSPRSFNRWVRDLTASVRRRSNQPNRINEL